MLLKSYKEELAEFDHKAGLKAAIAVMNRKNEKKLHRGATNKSRVQRSRVNMTNVNSRDTSE